MRAFCAANKKALAADGQEMFLLRNISRGRGLGFFEAGNFYPDFILWLLAGGKQFISFIEPHGLLHEGPASPKVLFHKKVKEVEARLGDPTVVLSSFILSWSRHATLNWSRSREQMEKEHVLFMTEDKAHYISKMLSMLWKGEPAGKP